MVFDEGIGLIRRLQKNKLIRGCIVTVLVWFFFRYLFSLAAPFFLAFVLITLLYPRLERIQKKIPVKKKYLAAGIILPLLLMRRFVGCFGCWHRTIAEFVLILRKAGGADRGFLSSMLLSIGRTVWMEGRKD